MEQDESIYKFQQLRYFAITSLLGLSRNCYLHRKVPAIVTNFRNTVGLPIQVHIRTSYISLLDKLYVAVDWGSPLYKKCYRK